MASIEKHITRQVVALDAVTPCREAAKVMRDKKIGAVAVREGGRVVGEYQQLVDPQRNISAGVSALTGITNAMVAGQPRFCDQLPAALPYLQGAIIVGHVGADHVAAGAPHRPVQLGIEGLGALGRGDAHDLARLDALASAECEVDQDGCVALEDLRGRCVRHGHDPIRWAGDRKGPRYAGPVSG